ncbi:MAG TPA: NAD(P)H-hydrate dehydratase [Blastocatellia bacterium]|jgi:NAD(P)H-hydrate epimerase|nr:NAD(P)H-hydrate dehydratase [Blastocatellia bacterium]
MKILSAAEMREVDRLTAEAYGVPSLMLMENAAARTVEAIEKRFGPVAGKRALIICGKGNNGGDGAAIARQLLIKGGRADVLLLGRVDETRGDARTNFEIIRSLASPDSGLRIIEVENPDHLRREAASASPDIFIDAIFGTGLTRPAAGLFAEAIHYLGDLRDGSAIIAVDIPSGLASDSQELIGPAVRARLTVTFTAPKIANVFPPASDYNGQLVVAPIGSPGELINTSGSRLSLVGREMIKRWLEASRRSSFANKGDAGKALVVAGSRGKSGAACLAGEGAMRAGAGLVTVATAQSAQPVIASQMIFECMSEPLVETATGSVAVEAAERVLELAGERDVVAMGPGLGSSEESTRSLVRSVVMKRARPMVLDADALNSLAPWPEELRGREELPLILTPHPGEMARLVEKSVLEVISNRAEVVREFATAHGVIVVLKGSRTCTASPGGEVYVNPTGNAGMATGGTGDVLTGIIAGLLAQKPDDPLAATIAAVYLHGLAGDIAASRKGTRAMMASDIAAHLGDAFIEVGGDQERFVR